MHPIISNTKAYRAIKIQNGRPVDRGYWTGIGKRASSVVSGALLFGPSADINPSFERLAEEGKNPEVVHVTVPQSIFQLQSGHYLQPYSTVTVSASFPPTNTAPNNYHVSSTDWMFVGQILSMPNLGTVLINAINTSLNVVTVFSTGAPGNVNVGTIIPVGTIIQLVH